ncbi:MAG: hypothetical protein NTY48_06125 [Candidatus Diapherotrites archaeon]|nr:hypothetical protein [Candidatus Diapherotrites archaeon]
MGFKDIISAAKKNTPQRSVPTSPMEPKNLVDVAENEASMGKTTAEKKDINYADSEIKGFIPQQRTFGSRNTTSNANAACGSIIRNIASQSNMNLQTGGNTNWNECTHRKEGFGKDYCKEYHSICYKEKCTRARK